MGGDLWGFRDGEVRVVTRRVDGGKEGPRKRKRAQDEWELGEEDVERTREAISAGRRRAGR